MKVPTKKSFGKIVVNLVIMVITFIVTSFIIKGSFTKIEWDILLILCSTFFIVSMILSDKKKKIRIFNNSHHSYVVEQL